MRRFFGRKKSDEEKVKEEEEETAAEEQDAAETAAATEPSAEAPAESVEGSTAAPPTDETEPPVERVRQAETIPYHDSLPKRLRYLLEESSIASTIEGPDEFSIELMASGERTWIKKNANGPIEYGSGAVPDEDVFIRVSDDVVSELLNASTFEEFSKIYMQYYRNSGPGKYVKIELRKAISDLNRRGYARVPLLKLLVGAARV